MKKAIFFDSRYATFIRDLQLSTGQVRIDGNCVSFIRRLQSFPKSLELMWVGEIFKEYN